MGVNVVGGGNLSVCCLGREGGRRFRTKERKKAGGLGNGRHWGPVGSWLRGLASWRSGICLFIMADFSASVSCLIQVNITRQRNCSILLQSKIEPTQAMAPTDKENPGLVFSLLWPHPPFTWSLYTSWRPLYVL